MSIQIKDFHYHEVIKSAASQYDTPFYIYFPELIQQRIDLVRGACSGMGIRYAVKTNPNPWLLQWMKGKVDSLDVSSEGELAKAIQSGWSGVNLEFTGPAKTANDLKSALDQGLESIVIESLSEIALLNEICCERGIVKRVLVRISPAEAEGKFGVRLAGRVTQFGVDEECLSEFIQEAKKLKHVFIDGFHIYSGSQCLDDAAMANHFQAMWVLFQKAMKELNRPISELVFGAGMGISYHEGDESLTLEELAPVTQAINKEISQLNFPVACFVEIGRFLVGEAGNYVTKVVRVKESRGTKIAICDGGMNHNLGACGHLGGVSHRHYKMDLIPFSGRAASEEKYRIVGPLCTSIDTLAHRIDMPEILAGDLISVHCGGSYGPSSSPLNFISHALPSEIVSESIDGKVKFTDVTWL